MRAILFSILYRLSRLLVTKCLYVIQFLFRKSKDLEPAMKFGDIALTTLNKTLSPLFRFKLPKNSSVNVYDLTFDSPLIISSFKSELPVLNMWLKMGMGGTILKTIMKEERLGNPRPRLQDAYHLRQNNILNSMGLPGPGIQKFCNEISSYSIWDFQRPVGVSVGGDNSNEYIQNIQTIHQTLESISYPYFYELNISCPNTDNGRTIGEDPDELQNIIQQIRSSIHTILSVKVSPDLSNSVIQNIGEVCKSQDKIILNVGNTQFKQPNEVGIHPDNFSMEGGGFSGPSLFPRTLEMVQLVSQFQIPIIATGGLSTIHHVRAAINKGATLCGMATALVLDPFCIPKINSQL